MTLAMKKLHGIGWVALVFLIAILLYPLSLQVASVHGKLTGTEAQITQTRREISYLQADLRTLANHSQLEEWNRVQYGYVAPDADQYLAGERALADLGGSNEERRPVLVSVSESLGGAAPSGEIGHRVPDPSDAPEQEAPARSVTAPAQKENSDVANRKLRAVAGDRLAQMETKLISSETLRDLGRTATAERMRP